MDNYTNIKNTETIVSIPVNKDLSLALFLASFSIIGCILIGYVLGSFLNPIYFSSIHYFIIGAIVTYFVYRGLAWKLRGKRLLVIDSKHMIIFETMMAISKQKVYKIEDISKITIDKGYSNNLWNRIKSFWTRGNVGCISFIYENKPVRIGDNLTVKDAEKLFSVLKEQEFLKEENFR